jgi:hypothetical protein
VANGYGNLVRQIEALLVQPLIRTDAKGIIVESEDFPAGISDKYIQKYLQIATEVVEKLNTTKLYGRDLNIYEPYDAGIIASWVSAIFEKFREKRYDPVAQNFSLGSQDYTLEDAAQAMYRFIELAKDLKGRLENAGYGKLPITDDTSDGAYARDLVNLYSNIALFLEENNLTGGKNALDLVTQLVPNGEKGSDLARKLVEVYRRCGVEKDAGDFIKPRDERGSALDWMAYGGIITLGAQIYNYAKYFGLDKENLDFDSIWGKDGAVMDMLQLGLDMGLPEKIKEYLGISSDMPLPIDQGYIAGIYTFWNQVLYAVANSVNDRDMAKRYVWAQLDARKKIREVLQDRDHHMYVLPQVGAIRSSHVAMLTFLEKTLDPQWAGLNDSLSLIEDALYSLADEVFKTGKNLDLKRLKDAIADGYFDSLPQPEARLYPKGISEAETWDWNQLLSGGPTADIIGDQFGFVSPEETTSVPELGGDFGSADLDLPPLL